MKLIKGLFTGLGIGLAAAPALYILALLLNLVVCFGTCGVYGIQSSCGHTSICYDVCGVGQRGGRWGHPDNVREGENTCIPGGIWSGDAFWTALLYCTIAGAVVGAIYGIAKQAQEISGNRPAKPERSPKTKATRTPKPEKTPRVKRQSAGFEKKHVIKIIFGVALLLGLLVVVLPPLLEALEVDLPPFWETLEYNLPGIEWLIYGWQIVVGAILFVFSLPQPIPILLFVPIVTACAGIVISHVLYIVKNRDKWKENSESTLMSSYFVHTGLHQTNFSYKQAQAQIRENTWIFSISGWTCRLRDLESDSVMIAFLLAVAYIPLAALSFIEVSVRVIVGSAYLGLCMLLHRLLLLITRLLTYALIPIGLVLDRVLRRKQYCPICYEPFHLPVFICPECGRTHDQLVPSEAGILFAKCACDQRFLSTMIPMGRSRLNCICPNSNCNAPLAAANAEQFFVHLIGGVQSGKTAYLTSLQDAYLNQAAESANILVNAASEEELDDAHVPQPHYFLHRYKHQKRAIRDNLVVFDVAGEVAETNAYSREPRHFAFCHGFLLFFDPASKDDFSTAVNQFLLKFVDMKGIAVTAMSDIPVAVIIGKTDLEVVPRELSDSSYMSNAEEQDKMCREYLEKMGLGHALRSLDARFTNIRFFPISTQTQRTEPSRILAPVAWIVKQHRNRLTAVLGK